MIVAVKLADDVELKLACEAIDGGAEVGIRSDNADALWIACGTCEQPWEEAQEHPCPGSPPAPPGSTN